MKMRFKIGDVVFIKTRTEICNIMDSNDCIGDCHFANDMFNHCGLTLTIDQIDDIQGLYRMKEDPWHLYNDDMISHLYEEKDSPRFAVGDNDIESQRIHRRIKEIDMEIDRIDRIMTSGTGMIMELNKEKNDLEYKLQDLKK